MSILTAFVVGLILFLPFPSWQQLVGFITSATVLSFGSGPLVLAAMRHQIPDHERPFHLPGGHTIPILAFCSSNLIVYWTGWQTDYKLFIAVLLGGVALAAMMWQHRRMGLRPVWDWRAGSWYIPWLVGLAVISWLGDYGGGLGVLHFESAIVVVIVFSVLVYLLAARLRLPSAAVLEHIELSRAEAAAEDAALDGAHS